MNVRMSTVLVVTNITAIAAGFLGGVIFTAATYKDEFEKIHNARRDKDYRKGYRDGRSGYSYQ